MTPKPLSNHFSFLNRFIIKKGDISTRLLLLLILSTLILFLGLGPLCSDLSQSSSSHLAVNEPLLSSVFGSDLQDAETSMHPLTCPGTVKNVVLPFSGFIQNLGQVSDNTIEYYYSSNGLSVGFSPSKITFVSETVEKQDQIYFSLTFPGSDIISPVGYKKNSYYTNYFYGDLHLTNVPSWQELWYYNLYPGIDLRYYMSSQGLKYDFVVHPGADPTQISLKVSESMVLDIEEQTVTLQSKDQPRNIQFQDTALQAWQTDGISISSRFISKDANLNIYGFQVDYFDPTQSLIIDPLVLSFSTYLGGSDIEYGEGIDVDDGGNTYITGSTWSSEFPILFAYQNAYGGKWDAFMTKLNATGTGLVFSTYLGGSSNDMASKIAVDAVGNSYITGYTQSSDFPVTPNAYAKRGRGYYDAFVTKLNSNGELVFSTYLGGGDLDRGFGIAVDAVGNSYITGFTISTDFPVTANAHQSTPGGRRDAFVTKLNATGTGLVFSTYLGGRGDPFGGSGYYGDDLALEIAADAEGNSYVTGYTDSNDFPVTPNAYQSTHGGGRYDVFVAKLNAIGGFIFSTYLGGDHGDYGSGIAVDMMGNCYIAGSTGSSNFPVTPNAYQSIKNGGSDAFVTKLNPIGTELVFSTFLGGSDWDGGYEIAVDANKNMYIAGSTKSNDFSVVNAYDNTHSGFNDVFVTKLNALGTDIVFSTYLGGSSSDRASGIAVDVAGNSYITGFTISTDFPIKNAYQSTYGGGYGDVFVTKLSYFGFSYPIGGEILTGTAIIQWYPILDPSRVLYSLFYSPDAGTTWYALATDLSVTTYSWNTTSVPDGSNYLLKMMVFNATGLIIEYISDHTFSIQNSPIMESGTPITETVGFFVALILTVILYRKSKKRRKRLYDFEG